MPEPGADPEALLNASIREAFTNEAAVFQLYQYFSSVADIEHFPEMGETLRNMAQTVSCLAHGHFDVLRYETDPVSGLPQGDTEQNLTSAIHAANEDASVRYVQMRQLAREAGLEDIVSWLDTVIAVKKHHGEKLAAMIDEIRRTSVLS
jgi:rubrerythrin